MKVGAAILAACLVSIVTCAFPSMEQTAHRQGFESFADHQMAAQAHFTDARLWQLEKRKRSAQTATAAERIASTKADGAAKAAEEDNAASRAAAALKAEAKNRQLKAERLARAEGEDRKASEFAKANTMAQQIAEAAAAKARAEKQAEAQKVAREAAAKETIEVAKAQAEAEAQARAEAEAAQAAKAQAEAEAEANQAAMREQDEALSRQSTDRSIILFKAALKDADSADVQGLRVVRLSDHRVALCGVLNAKNSFGSYVGFRRFVVSADLEVAQFESVVQNASFDSAWTNWCDH